MYSPAYKSDEDGLPIFFFEALKLVVWQRLTCLNLKGSLLIKVVLETLRDEQ